VKLKPTITTEKHIISTVSAPKTERPTGIESRIVGVTVSVPTPNDDPNAEFTNEQIYAMKLEHFSTNMDKLVEALGFKIYFNI
jgi:hypothetical protein